MQEQSLVGASEPDCTPSWARDWRGRTMPRPVRVHQSKAVQKNGLSAPPPWPASDWVRLPTRRGPIRETLAAQDPRCRAWGAAKRRWQPQTDDPRAPSQVPSPMSGAGSFPAPHPCRSSTLSPPDAPVCRSGCPVPLWHHPSSPLSYPRLAPWLLALATSDSDPSRPRHFRLNLSTL